MSPRPNRPLLSSAPFRAALFGYLVLFPWAVQAAAQESPALVLVTIDGLRWQEMVSGIDPSLLTEEQGVRDPAPLLERFGADDPKRRRELLMPFLWGVVHEQGQLFADHAAGGGARVTNGKNFSYPGYSELLVGSPDGRIDSNDKVTNPNRTVLEHLAEQGRVTTGQSAVFASWDVFPWIVAVERSRLFVNAGWQPLELAPATPAQEMLNSLMLTTPREWEGVRFDSFTFRAAMTYLERERPRLLYLALGEPDDWAHERRYGHYVDATRRCDDLIAELWLWLQSQPDYAGRTTLLITTDHGRGRTEADWTSHGSDVDGADEAWIAVIGPRISARGLRNDERVTLSQVAATMAQVFGMDLPGLDEKAARPLPIFAGHD